ncbi:MAG: hypothetical protein JXD22_08830 [Sedimentisphaerales bacterium]|nr:hypothetical protein [Sedimentisphaerales bacterium]
MKRLSRFFFNVTRPHIKHSWIVLTAVILISTAGCGTKSQLLQQRLSDLHDIRLDTALRQCLAASGGIEPWSRLHKIEAKAVATVFEPDGSQDLIEQQQTIELQSRPVISVLSKEPSGMLRENLSDDGQAEIIFLGPMNPVHEQNPEKLYGAALKLRLLGHALLQVPGILHKDLIISYLGQERKAGRLMHKIEISGLILGDPELWDNQNQMLLIAWIDTETHQFSRLWMRYPLSVNKIGYLGLTMSDYRQTDQGLMLPGRIEVIRSDEHQQFGQDRILMMEYQQFNLELLEKNEKPFFGLF